MGVGNFIFILFAVLKRTVEMTEWARLWGRNWGNCSISQGLTDPLLGSLSSSGLGPSLCNLNIFFSRSSQFHGVSII